MKVLLIGGTGFIGRHVVSALLAGGHAVTVFTRGLSDDTLPATVQRLQGDRDAGPVGLAALHRGRWDACVDFCAYRPGPLRDTLAALHGRIGQYVFISAVMVYGDPAERPVLEGHPRLTPAGDDVTEIDDRTYGPLKVACEDLVLQTLGDRATVLRPQTVVGPHDPSGRYAYWVQRAERSGQGAPMLAPGDGSDHLQCIDVRDLAAFVRLRIECGHGGVFNLAGPRLTWADFLRLLGAQRMVWVPADVLQAAGVDFRELPLFRPEHGHRAGLMHIDSRAAQAAGLTLRTPADTLRDTRAWLQGRPPPAWMTPEREAALIAVARIAHNRRR